MSKLDKLKNLSKKNKIIMIVVACVLVVAIVLTVSLCVTLIPREKIELSIKATQVDKSQQINVEWETSILVDSVQVTVTNSQKQLVSAVTVTNPVTLASGHMTVDAAYGKQTVEVIARKTNGVKSSASKQVNVFTDEYVIAPLIATMPVTYFSLNITEYTQNYTIPTFVWLQRGAAWNYANLHENVYLVPFGTYSDMAAYMDGGHMYDMTSKWIKELYEINPNSKFHLYYNDYHPWGWLQATVANGIPTDNYDLTLLSDGTGSYYAFSKYMNGTDSDVQFEKMCKTYRKLKSQIAKKGKYKSDDITLALKTNELRNYVMCMITEEPNVKLVLARDFISRDMPKDSPMQPVFAELVANAEHPDRPIQILSMYSLLQAMTEDQKVELRNLYNFSDNMFEKAVQENKKIMVLLGSYPEPNFDGLVKASKAYYGDDYVYYYKGHPATPTQMDEAKIKKLEALNLIDVDSTISAELIFFFNQEACATGYGSSTYNSLLDEQVCGVWNTRLSNVDTTYGEKVDFTITKLEANDSQYGSLASGSCYLFEFADKTNYDIAVYYESQNKIKFYKQNGNGFTEVSR